jgi:GntR family transcriptional regulator
MSGKKTPLYIQIKDDLLNMINSGFNIGDKLPSEAELSASLQVSRVTVREALKEIENEGLIERIQGSGTFITRLNPVVTVKLDMLDRLSAILDGPMVDLRTTKLNVERVKANSKVAGKLKINEGEDVIIFDRIRNLNGIPAIRSIDIIPFSILPDNYTIESMGHSLSDFLGVHLAKSEAKLIPVRASEHLAELLHISPNTLCLMLEEVTFNSNGQAIDYSHYYFVAHLFNFVISRTKP